MHRPRTPSRVVVGIFSLAIGTQNIKVLPMSILPPINLKYLLVKARDILALVAPVTPLKTDDAIVAVMTALIEDATLFGYFEKAVDAEDSGKLSLVGEPPVALQTALEDRKLDWGKLLTYLPTIIEIIRAMRG